MGLALVPKCPMCLAAYVALATGVALPLPAATWLRLALLTMCAAALVVLAGRSIRRALSIRLASDRPSFGGREYRHT